MNAYDNPVHREEVELVWVTNNNVIVTVQRSSNNTEINNRLVLPGNRIGNPVQKTWRSDPLLQEGNKTQMSTQMDWA